MRNVILLLSNNYLLLIITFETLLADVELAVLGVELALVVEGTVLPVDLDTAEIALVVDVLLEELVVSEGAGDASRALRKQNLLSHLVQMLRFLVDYEE